MTSPLQSARSLFPVVGLEIHAQLISRSKLFSASSSRRGQAVNTQADAVDCALPGTLPTVNIKCVRSAVAAVLALNGRLNMTSYFDRKHYFYADLPAGYQITQQRRPIGVDGHIDYYVFDHRTAHDVQYAKRKTESTPQHLTTTSAYVKRTRILKMQLEQDSGKSLQDLTNDRTLVDLNRAGMPLIEIVTEPNLSNGIEAYCLVRELQHLLRSWRVCDGQMEDGHLRVDVNVSISNLSDASTDGVRTEIKNLNSLKSVQTAVDFEIQRHLAVIENGGTIVNETLGFDYRTGQTVQMRDKEVRQDYRFMPEPNLLPLRLYDSSKVEQSETPSATGQVDIAPVLNDQMQRRPSLCDTFRQLQAVDRLDDYRANFLTLDPSAKDYYDQVLAYLNGDVSLAPLLADWLIEQLYPYLKDQTTNADWLTCPVRPDRFADLVLLLHNSKITDDTAQAILTRLVDTPEDDRFPTDIVAQEELWMIADVSQVEQICEHVLKHEHKAVKQWKRNVRRPKLMKFFTRKAQEKCDYRLNNETVVQCLTDMLEKL